MSTTTRGLRWRSRRHPCSEAGIPIVFDEWQVEPGCGTWSGEVDDRALDKGQFILTGSATPNDDISRHSGAGRIATLRMRPMSLFESGYSSGAISIAGLLAGAAADSPDPKHSLDDVVERIVCGGWPGNLTLDVRQAARAVRDYLTQVVEVDVDRLGAERRDPGRLTRLIASLARNTATEVATTVLAADTNGPDGSLARSTIARYLQALDRLMLVEDLPAWAPHLRSRVPLRQSAKRHFVDPSLAAAALNAGPDRLRADLEWTGLLFESMVVRDLRIYSQPLGGSLHHVRDAKGHDEVDAVLTLPDGRWGCVEVKMGTTQIDVAATTLLRFAGKVDHSRMGPPSFLAVITMSGFGYRRPDGVQVVPIGVLGP